MQAPLKEKNDIKIFILYLLKNLNYPLDFNTISDIVVQDEFVNYFDSPNASPSCSISETSNSFPQSLTSKRTVPTCTGSPQTVFRSSSSCKVIYSI